MTGYRTVEVGGLEIFYREAGRGDAPTILLLHGFPLSERVARIIARFYSKRVDVGGSGR